MSGMFHRRVTSRVAVGGLGILLAVTVVGGAPSIAHAHNVQIRPTVDTTANTEAVACSTQLLRSHASGRVRFVARLGGTTARLLGDAVTRHWQQWLKQPQLVVSDARNSWRVQLQPARGAFRDHYLPTEVGVRGTSERGYVCLGRFAGDAHPMAILGVYSGFAHCCWSYRVFNLESRQVSHLGTGNSGALLVRGNRHALIQSANDVFSYAFTSFAGSGRPIQLFRPDGAAFTDVTTTHPARVRANARFWWRAFRHTDDGRGLLAAWAADQELLGRDQHVVATLRSLQDDPRLAARTFDHRFGWPGGERYVSKLLRFLHRQGYRD